MVAMLQLTAMLRQASLYSRHIMMSALGHD